MVGASVGDSVGTGVGAFAGHAQAIQSAWSQQSFTCLITLDAHRKKILDAS